MPSSLLLASAVLIQIESQIVDYMAHVLRTWTLREVTCLSRRGRRVYSDGWWETGTEKDREVRGFVWDFSFTEARCDEGRHWLSSLAMLMFQRQQKWPTPAAICFIFYRPFYFYLYLSFEEHLFFSFLFVSLDIVIISFFWSLTHVARLLWHLQRVK